MQILPTYGVAMFDKTSLIEFLLAGFFAIGCIRAHDRLQAGQKTRIADFFRLSGRLERLRRSRWQWFSMVAIMLVLRLQQQLPPAVEIMVAVQFVIFLLLPVQGLLKPSLARGGR
jgi:hypothetical protein